MSHSIRAFQNMSTPQLIHEMKHAAYSIDRQRAQEVYQQRLRDQARAENERRKQQSDALQNNSKNLQSRIKSLFQQNANLANIINKQTENLNTLQVDHNKQVAELRNAFSKSIEKVITENNNALNELSNQVNQTTADMQSVINANYERTTSMINGMHFDLSNRINDVQMGLQNQLDAQRRQIDTLEQNFLTLKRSDEQLKKNAEEYLEAAKALINSTIEFNNANFHNWRSNDLAKLITDRNNVENDLAAGTLAVGSARSNARKLFDAALDYRSNVHADERNWAMHRAVAQQFVDAALADLAACEFIEDGNEKLDVNYWTSGDLLRIEEQLNALQSQLTNPSVTQQELTAISELAETYRQEIQNTVNFAIHAKQLSYCRKDLLQEAVMNIKRDMGNMADLEFDYFAKDDRLGYRVLLTSPLGEKVVLTAEPVIVQNEILNEFKFEILSTGIAFKNAADAAKFTKDIEKSLNQLEGIEFNNAVCTNTDAPPADNGESNQKLWQYPDKNVKEAALTNIKPVAPTRAIAPTPKSKPAFTPQALI